jgi:hypothetical protein
MSLTGAAVSALPFGAGAVVVPIFAKFGSVAAAGGDFRAMAAVGVQVADVSGGRAAVSGGAAC